MFQRVIVIALSVAISALAAPVARGDACLTPVSPVEAEVVSLGPTNGGLEELEVHVRGFELAGPAAVGCTIALSLEPQIFPAFPCTPGSAGDRARPPGRGGRSPGPCENRDAVRALFGGQEVAPGGIEGKVAWPLTARRLVSQRSQLAGLRVDREDGDAVVAPVGAVQVDGQRPPASRPPPWRS